jgi:hypothetical protein
MIIEPEISGVSIVLVGHFNPAIFSPAWLAKNYLITDKVAEDTEVQIIHPQVTRLSIPGIDLQVEVGKFSATTSEAPYVALRDFTVQLFGSCLPHTPINMLGINRDVHFRVGSRGAVDQIGHRLGPPEAWGEWAPRLRAGEGEKHGGLFSITMQEKDLSDRPAGHRQATVQPSQRIEDGTGIFVQVNDHYVFGADKEMPAGAESVIPALEAGFDDSIRNSEWVINQVMGIAHDVK